ncbi:BREX-2 system phosphatase PglZ [Dactylosporangium sp. NBC_01737]|uniref:BREX-2 system phosphatase PglZ n=1 Tax=Dactylosporangium sp. NBC_01737 TaxID=2975959 RepID=UPI002E0F1156|nr:BREX-2 system phosphatase PglZ [Dactylosporangium sp. NBC_01737]
MTSAAAAIAAPVATEAQVRAMVVDWLRSGRREPVLALFARPQWTGEPVLRIGDTVVRIKPARSSLAVRAALVELTPGERLVVLTDRDDDDLGAGVLAHCSNQTVLNIDPWEIVRAHFEAAALDPALVRQRRHLAEALLEYAPAGGWPPVRGGVVTRDGAMRLLSARLLGIGPDDLDATGVVQWTLRGSDVVRYTAVDARLRAIVAGWLAETAGPTARWTLAAVDAGHGTDAIPLGLIAGLLWDGRAPTAAVAAARVRFEQFLGGATPREHEAAEWNRTVLAWVVRALGGEDKHEVQRILGRAEDLVRQLQAASLVGRSDLLPGGLDARLKTFAEEVRAALRRMSTPTLEAAEAALRMVAQHRLAPVGDQHLTALMAMRALRWLAMPDEPPATLADAVDRQVTTDGWLDRARLRLWVGVSDPALAAVYRELHAAVDARRTHHDEQFAALLAATTRADSPAGGMYFVEDVVRRVVKPLVDADRPVFLLVVDGMGAAASTELVESAVVADWWELTAAGGRRAGVVAALPTVTEVSRTSLFAGELRRGGQVEERAGLRQQLGSEAVLFHKADLLSGAGQSLASPVVAALRDPSIRTVAAVVNTIDDALDRSDPAATAWTLDAVRMVRHLLDAARGRVVVMLSDHGHVVDRGPDGELRGGTGVLSARWRPTAAGPPAGDGEIRVAGRRVVLADGDVILPWRETVRYSARKACYHGGASAAEVVIPLTILTAAGEPAPAGWSAAPVASPAWWRGPVSVSSIVTPIEEATLFDIAPAAPHAETIGTAPTFVAALLASTRYKRNRALRLAGRPVLPDERVSALLTALHEAGGRLPLETLAARADVPAQRIANVVTILRRVLAVEGYQAVEVDGQIVTLDEKMLRDQFELGTSA